MRPFNILQADFLDLMGTRRYSLKDMVSGGDFPPGARSAAELAWTLIKEEVTEELRMHLHGNLLANTESKSVPTRLHMLSEITDDIVDSIYVLCQLGNVLGLPIHKAFHGVHYVGNMSKAITLPDGSVTVRRREDGKVLKPEGWRPFDVEGLLYKELFPTADDQLGWAEDILKAKRVLSGDELEKNVVHGKTTQAIAQLTTAVNFLEKAIQKLETRRQLLKDQGDTRDGSG